MKAQLYASRQLLRKLVHAGLVAALALFPLSVHLVPVAHATPPSPTFTGGSNVSGLRNENIAISDLQVTGVTDPAVDVHLFVPSGNLAFGTVDGLTFTGNTSGNSLYFSGSQTDVNTALATLHFNSGVVGSVTMSATMVGAGESYNPANGHVYEVVQTGTNIYWTDAKVAADARTKHGAAGYLATVTSSSENDFVLAQLGGVDGWIGASDLAEEGNWKWVDGPEAGTSFYSGLGYDGGHAVDDQYVNWNTNEPNGGTEESCGQYTGSSSRWNDLPCDTFPLSGYVVEYGAPGDLPVVPSKSLTITNSFPTAQNINISNCDQLLAIDDNTANEYNHYRLTADVDCSAIDNFLPIGNDGNGWDGDPFQGTFDGQGHTISNLNITGGNVDTGLFAWMRNATIQNLNLHGGRITIDADGWQGIIGGVVGEMESSTVRNVHSDIDVDAQSSWAVGGIVGYADNYDQDNAADTLITDCSYSGQVLGQISVGGIVGAIESYDGFSTTVSKSYADNYVWAEDNAGGIVGSAYTEAEDRDYEPDTAITLTNTYSNALITADDNSAGGILGSAESYNDGYDNNVTVEVSKSYADGVITANNNAAGGLVGNIVLGDNNDQEQYKVLDSFAVAMVQTDSEESPFALVGGVNWDSNSTYMIAGNVVDSARTQSIDDTYRGEEDTQYIDIEGSEPDYFFNNHSNDPLSSWDFDTIWVQHEADFPTFTDAIIDAGTQDLTSAEDGSPIVVAQSGCEAITDASTSKESSLSVTDPAFSYPVGFASFTLTGCETGGTATVTATFYGSFNIGTVVIRKYNPTSRTYTTLTADNGLSLSATTLGGIAVTYQVKDGGPLDADGAEDGRIVDPIGVGVNAAGAPNTGLGNI